MPDVKVTPTEADREAAWPILAALGAGEDDRAQLMAGWDDENPVVQAFARARLQGWNECREAAAKVADAHEASNYEQGEYGSGWDAASRSIADAIEALPCPSTPES